MNKKILREEDMLFLDEFGINAVGNLLDKRGYERVKLDFGYLKAAINILELQRIKEITLFVKTDSPFQIGTDKIGVIIAPRVDIKREDQ